MKKDFLDEWVFFHQAGVKDCDTPDEEASSSSDAGGYHDTQEQRDFQGGNDSQ